MSIKGSTEITNCGIATLATTESIGLSIAGAGIIVGYFCGWHALAISLIAVGGAITILGVSAGCVCAFRGESLKNRDAEITRRAHQTFSMPDFDNIS